MSVAAIVAALGVIRDNPILIVGAMAVSPDILPICAVCVGLVGRRFALALRSGTTLLLGLLLVAGVGCGLAALLDATDVIDGVLRFGSGGLETLGDDRLLDRLDRARGRRGGDALLETRAAAAVGVAISVTTIPASALLGVAVGLGDFDKAGGAALVLAVNVTLLIVSGSVTLAVQTWLARRRAVPTA